MRWTLNHPRAQHIASGMTGGPYSGPYDVSSSSSDGDCLLVSGATCVNVVTGMANPTRSGRNGAMFFTFIIFSGAYICGLMNWCVVYAACLAPAAMRHACA